MPLSLVGHDIPNPVQEVADFGVDTIQVFIGAPLPPTHHARQEPGFLVARHQRSTAVPFTGILSPAFQPGTEHVPGDVELRVETTLLQRDSGQHQPLEDCGWGAKPRHAAPTGHSGMTDGGQCSGEGAVLRRKTNGDHEESQLDRAVQLQHGQVFVIAGLVVARVDHHFDHSPLLLSLLNQLTVVFTFTDTAQFLSN